MISIEEDTIFYTHDWRVFECVSAFEPTCVLLLLWWLLVVYQMPIFFADNACCKTIFFSLRAKLKKLSD